MSAKKIWYPSESVVAELPGAHPTIPESGSNGDNRSNTEISNASGSGATLAKSKQKITRRRTPTVDTNTLRNDCTSSEERLETDQCGRGTAPTTYSTIEDTGPRASIKTLLSNLMQYEEPILCKDTNFHGWLHNDPILQWRNIFLPKLQHPMNKNVKENNRTRRHRSEEFIFQHYKDISEYMNYYRRHCCLTSLSVPSLKQPRQHQKPKTNTGKQDKKSMRPSTRGVFRIIDDQQECGSTENKQSSPQNPRLVELEYRLNLTASVVSSSKSLPIVARPTPPSIVNRESTSIVLCGSGSSSSEKYTFCGSRAHTMEPLLSGWSGTYCCPYH